MLRAQGLHKRFGERVAVDDVSLQVAAGEILGLLGPNGAGKSTTIGMIAGLIAPDAGEVSVAGVTLQADAHGYKRRIGLVPQELALYENLGALANLQLFGALYGVAASELRERASAALALVGLGDRARERPATFSGGMKRRLNIACALIHDPAVLLLDEPTAGVDPQSRNAIFDNLEALRRQGKALVYTTHYMEEAERLADRIAIIDHGRVVAEGALGDLIRRLPGAQSLEFECDRPVEAAGFAALPGVAAAHGRGNVLAVATDDIAGATAQVLVRLQAAGCSLQHIDSRRATLEDVFLALTGRQLRD